MVVTSDYLVYGTVVVTSDYLVYGTVVVTFDYLVYGTVVVTYDYLRHGFLYIIVVAVSRIKQASIVNYYRPTTLIVQKPLLSNYIVSVFKIDN